MRYLTKRLRLRTAIAAAIVAGTAIGASGAEPRKFELRTATENAEERLALLVGVDDYGGALPALKHAASDVERTAETLEKIGFPRENVRKLVSGAGEASRPSRERFLTALDEIVRKSGPDSTVVVAFFGRGFQTLEDGLAALAPIDARFEFRDGTDARLTS